MEDCRIRWKRSIFVYTEQSQTTKSWNPLWYSNLAAHNRRFWNTQSRSNDLRSRSPRSFSLTNSRSLLFPVWHPVGFFLVSANRVTSDARPKRYDTDQCPLQKKAGQLYASPSGTSPKREEGEVTGLVRDEKEENKKRRKKKWKRPWCLVLLCDEHNWETESRRGAVTVERER